MAEANGNGTARWQLWVSLAGVGVILLGSMMTLYVQVSTAYATAEELKARVDRLANQVNDDRTRISSVCARLVEVETQFKSSDQMRNQLHVSDLRLIAALWKKTYGEEYPIGGLDLPNIAQDHPEPC